MTDQPVIALSLDAAESTLINRWCEEGKLPNIAALKNEGAYVPLASPAHFTPESRWASFYTGCSPSTLGYWGSITYDPKTYNMGDCGAFALDHYQPFFSFGNQHSSILFDIPSTQVNPSHNGAQVVGWGVHNSKTEYLSSPNFLSEEIKEKYGIHPALEKDHIQPWQHGVIKWLESSLIDGIEMRTDISLDLLKQYECDFFYTNYGETHSGGHSFWHLSQQDHPLSLLRREEDEGDPLLNTYQAIDKGIGKIKQAKPNATFVVFAAQGMEENNLDISSNLFLAELMFRYSFPGECGFPDNKDKPLTPITNNQEFWIKEIWKQCSFKAEKPHSLREKLHAFSHHEHFAKPLTKPNPKSPFYFSGCDMYKDNWPHMKAFALPSFANGIIRINLIGRERDGMVPICEYDKVCDEITELLEGLTNPRNGNKLVKEVIRMQKYPLMPGPKDPCFDLMVKWHPQAADVVESNTLGRIGPIPFMRTGGHNDQGFAIFNGATIQPGTYPEHSTLDMAPTMREFVGAELLDSFEGNSFRQVIIK